MAREDRPTAAYYAGVAAAAGGFELGQLGYKHAFVPKSKQTGPKMPRTGVAGVARSVRRGNWKAAGARAARVPGVIASGLGSKLRHGTKYGLPAIVTGAVGAGVLGAYGRSRGEAADRAAGVKSVAEPREGAGATTGRLVGGLLGGMKASSVMGGAKFIAGRNPWLKIGAQALAGAGGGVAGDWAGGRVGRGLDRYSANRRRRIEKAVFSEGLAKALRDGDGDGRVNDGTAQEQPAPRSFGDRVRRNAAVMRGRAEEAASSLRREITRFRDLPLEGKAQTVVSGGVRLAARIEGTIGLVTPGTGVGGALMSLFGLSHGEGPIIPRDIDKLDEALNLYADKAGLDARQIVRNAKSPQRIRALVRMKLEGAKRLFGLLKSGWDCDTLALAWMAREGLATPGQMLELRRRLA